MQLTLMIFRYLSFLIILAVSASHFCSAQYLDDKVLMTVAGREVQAGEFIRMYLKSKNPDSINELDSYLDLFINFKLKVTDAIENGYDTTKAFKNELNGYREQLARNYIFDDKAMKEKVLREAYERSLWEVNAWHILVECPATAMPKDSLAAYKKADEIRDRLVNGNADFAETAKEYSDDRSAVANGGNLGYFSVFRMIKPFEDAVYSLMPGEISIPVRSQFGYHIIRLADKRPSRGKIKVAHIMKSVSPDTDSIKEAEAEVEINRLYALLEKGNSFGELASKYSDHRESAQKGGELDWFATGEMPHEFSETAFALRDSGDFSKPIRTSFGYHIIMLLGKKSPGSFDDIRSLLESRINPNYITEKSKKSAVNRLKADYNYRINTGYLEWFRNNTDTSLLKGKVRYNYDNIPRGNLYTFANQYCTNEDFATYVEKTYSGSYGETLAQMINNMLDHYSANHILQYENSNLEEKYPDFRYLINEFHDGILLFDISSEKVWNRSQEDTTGLKNFYNKHKKEFGTEFAAIRGDVISAYQDWLMEEWLRKLKKKYAVKVDATILNEVSKKIAYE